MLKSYCVVIEMVDIEIRTLENKIKALNFEISEIEKLKKISEEKKENLRSAMLIGLTVFGTAYLIGPFIHKFLCLAAVICHALVTIPGGILFLNYEGKEEKYENQIKAIKEKVKELEEKIERKQNEKKVVVPANIEPKNIKQNQQSRKR